MNIIEKEIKRGLMPERFWVKDIDGNILKTYRVVKYLITENLKTEHYNDGTSIPIIANAEEWEKNTIGAMCYYNNDWTYKGKYGALYNFYAVNTEKLAPKGWRVPTDYEWKEIEIALGMSSEDANKISSRGYISDKMREVLEVVPAGYQYLGGGFYYLDKRAIWWSTSVNDTKAWFRELCVCPKALIRNTDHYSQFFSVRCIRELSVSEPLSLFESSSRIYVSPSLDINCAESIVSASDQQLINELKRRGYTGQIEKLLTLQYVL